ncbi:hypothetical protein GCM10010425_65310 [Streptomyces spororaveus]
MGRADGPGRACRPPTLVSLLSEDVDRQIDVLGHKPRLGIRFRTVPEIPVAHTHARLIIHGRRLLVDRVRAGRHIAHGAEEMGISRTTARTSDGAV